MSRQYISAAKAVDAVDSGRQSFKSYCGTAGKIGKVDFALAAETMKYSSILQTIFEMSGVTAEELDVGSGMLKVMSYELLFGKKKISGGGAVKRAVLEVREKIMVSLKSLMTTKGVSDHEDLLSDEVTQASKMPKFIRINEIKMPSIEEGFSVIMEACPLAVMDDVIPSLVVVPSGKSLGEHPYVKDGRLIIQDKASCFPSQCLYDVWSNNEEGDIIDACAAPGNKTSHMAALTERHRKNGVKCKIFAFDKNPRRAKLLQMRMESAGAQKIIDVSNEDFLNVEVSSLKYTSVSCILLDPSCSGSGVARALERVIERGVDEGARPKLRTEIDLRLEKLRAFQLSALRKAMSFPSARYIVYSTCSIFKEENESVIAEALGLVSSSGLVLSDFVDSTAAWTLVEPLRLANWTRRGDPYPGLPVDLQKKLIRCHPSDGLNGFFVAVLKRECSIDTAASRSSFPETSAVGSVCPLVMARPAPTSSQVISPIRKRKSIALDHDSSLRSDTVESVSAALSVKAQKVTTSSHMATPKRIHSRPFLKAFKQKRR